MLAGSPGVRKENRLLAALPRREFRRLESKLEPVELALRQTLYEANGPVSHAYFPRTCVFSLVVATTDGAVEVGTVGNEGMAGLPAFLGTGSLPSTAIVQVPGDAVRLRAEDLRAEAARGGALRDVLNRYTQFQLVQAAQSAACNRLHAAERRLSRWLLVMHDRVGDDRFPLTQEFLAQMLGVRRATVSVVAGTLQRAGLIRYSRGRVTVVDRAGLEGAACECYGVVRRELERLLGGGV